MRSIFIKLTIAVTLAAGFSSCKKWLDLQPEDKFTEEQVYTDKDKIAQTLNGLYADMISNNLYGAKLTMTTVEVLAQRWNVPSSTTNVRSLLQTYKYTDAGVKGEMESIWRAAYKSISNINVFITNLDKYSGQTLPAATLALYKGEALGLRSMIHLDVLRLFGPVYSLDSAVNSIPYYSNVSTTLGELLPARQIMDSIVRDLNYSSTLLSADPVITKGPQRGLLYDGADFTRFRNYRMNYYAVQGLLARAQLYRGNKPAALDAAVKTINATTQWFPWVAGDSVMIANDPDKVFTTEILFGIDHQKMYENQLAYYTATLQEGTIYAPLAGRLTTTYENLTNDYRYHDSWLLPPTGKAYRTFFKYEQPLNRSKPFLYYMPMIRLSELYYIAAETETDVTRAFGYLNAVRQHRGLAALATTATLQTEIQKEYEKEFYGEGQMFYYYKRKYLTRVNNASATSGTITMSRATYVVPLPDSETQYR